MKVTDYIAKALADAGVSTVFGYQGSSVSHIIDSLCASDHIDFVEMRHEQAAAFAANGYSLASGSIGVAVACSGPGATNLVTGIANSYYDSTPCLFITGQVSTREIKSDNSLRQLGFQESEICEIVSSVAKRAISVRHADEVPVALMELLREALRGRPGPVLLDIPHDVQTSEVDTHCISEASQLKTVTSLEPAEQVVTAVKDGIAAAQRPLMLIGGGCRPAFFSGQFQKWVEEVGIPIVASYRGKDLVDNRCQNFIGVVGAYGNRYANWAIEHSDYLLVLGSRLDGRQVSSIDTLASGGRLVVVDIDPAELKKLPTDVMKIRADTGAFLRKLADCAKHANGSQHWLSTIRRWKYRYPDSREYDGIAGVNPSHLMDSISAFADDDAIIALDVGQNQIWANALLSLHAGHRLLQSCGLGSMGFSLPAAIGGFFASFHQVICICGDGGIQMCLPEMQTAYTQQIPVKLFLLNNHSLGLIRDYQNKALGGRHFGSVLGFGSPDYAILSRAFGFDYVHVDGNSDVRDQVKLALTKSGPVIIEVEMGAESVTHPEPAYRMTFFDQSPKVPSDELACIAAEAQKLSVCQECENE